MCSAKILPISHEYPGEAVRLWLSPPVAAARPTPSRARRRGYAPNLATMDMPPNAAKRSADAAGLTSRHPNKVREKPVDLPKPQLHKIAKPTMPPGAATEKPRMQGAIKRGSRMLVAAGGAAPPPPSVSNSQPGSKASDAGPSAEAAGPPQVASDAQVLVPVKPQAMARGEGAAVAIKMSPAAPLPRAYKELLESFEGLERALPLVRARGLPLLYGILATSIERATSRECSPSILAAILGVWPEAYTLEVTEVRNLPEQRARIQYGSSNQKHDWLLAPSSASSASGAHATSTSTSTARISEFARRLDALVRAHEATWREAQGANQGEAPVEHNQVAALTFPLDACPPPPTAELPPLPVPKREALPRCAAAASDTSEAARAAAETAAAAADGAAFIPKADTSAFAEAAEAASTSSASGCAGLSSALLAKVLQREAAEKQKQAEAPVIDLAAQLKRLPLLADSMRSIYHEENKRIMQEAKLFAKLLQNPRWLTSQDELSSQMKLLARIVPYWCTLVSVNEQPAVKLDMNLRFAEVQKALKAAAATGVLPADV